MSAAYKPLTAAECCEFIAMVTGAPLCKDQAPEFQRILRAYDKLKASGLRPVDPVVASQAERLYNKTNNPKVFHFSNRSEKAKQYWYNRVRGSQGKADPS